MKPVNISEQRVHVGIGDFLYLMGKSKLYFVKEVRSNRREISSGAITEAKEVTVSADTGWAKGTTPNRILQIVAMAINDTSGNGRVTDIKFGNESILSKDNVNNVVLDTNTCGESGGATAIGQVRWGAIPLDLFIWDGTTIIAVCNTASGSVTFAMDFDVREFVCKEMTVEAVKVNAPDTVILASRNGSRRVSWNDFQKLQSWL